MKAKPPTVHELMTDEALAAAAVACVMFRAWCETKADAAAPRHRALWEKRIGAADKGRAAFEREMRRRRGAQPCR